MVTRAVVILSMVVLVPLVLITALLVVLCGWVSDLIGGR